MVVLARTELRLHVRHRIAAGVAVLTLVWIVVLRVLPASVRPSAVAWVLFLDVATVGFYLAPALLQVERANGVTAALRLTRVSPHQVLGVRLGGLVGWAVLAAVAVTVGAGIGWAPVVWLGAGATALVLSALAIVLVGRDETLTGYLPRIPPVGVLVMGPALAYGTGLSDHPLLWLSPATGGLELLFGRWSWGGVASLLVGTTVLWVRRGTGRPGRASAPVRARRRAARAGDGPVAVPRRGAVRSFASVDRRTLLSDGMLLLLVLGIPLLALLVRVGTGPGLDWLEGRTGTDLTAHLPLLWALVLVVHAPLMAGAMTGLLFLEDRDAGLLPALATTRAGLRTLVGYRLGVAAGMTVVAIVVSLPLAGAQHAAGLPGVVVTAVAAGAVSAVPRASDPVREQPLGELGVPLVEVRAEVAALLAVAHDPAVDHVQDPLGPGGDLRVVGDQHDGRPLRVELAEDVHDLGGGAGVERAGRLVAEQDRRLVDQRPADPDPLQLPTGRLGHVPVCQLGDAGPFHQRPRPRVELLPRCQTGQVGRQHHVVEQAQVLEQVDVLEDEPHRGQPEPSQLLLGQVGELLPGEQHAARGHPVHAADVVEQRGLAGPRGAHDGDELPVGDLQVEVLRARCGRRRPWSGRGRRGRRSRWS
jgi:fluoroquinolone transport system permease protein